MPEHPFDQAVALTQVATADRLSRWRGATHSAYWNMVGPFGGITAATLLQAVLQHPERAGDPVSLTLTYAAPIREGDFEIRTHLVAATRSTQHWSVQLLQGADGEVAVNAIAMFAKRRDTWSACEAAMPEVAPAEQTPLQTVDAFPMAWLRRYSLRFLRGGLDDITTGPHSDSTSQLWVSDVPPRALDFTSLAAICDVFFPRIYLRRGAPLQAGTVSMNIYFHADAQSLTGVGADPVLSVARGVNFRRGFFDQAAEIWSQGGALLASTQQLVWYKN